MAKEHVRNFAKFFTNLTPGQQRELERALAELDNQQEITNLVSTLDFVRKKPRQNMAVPEILATPIVRGALLEWEPLPDQRVSTYEINVSEDPNFSSFSTSFTFGNSVAIEGINLTTFVRIRGVRTDGSQGPFSDTVTINPIVFAIKARTQEVFYFYMNTNQEQQVLGGPGTVFEYQPINEAGFTMVWGNVSVYGNPDIDIVGRPEFTISTRSEDSITEVVKEEWLTTPSGYWGTYQIGPFAVPHPLSQGVLQIGVFAKDLSIKTPSFYPSVILYGHLNAFELGVSTNTTGLVIETEPDSGN